MARQSSKLFIRLFACVLILAQLTGCGPGTPGDTGPAGPAQDSGDDHSAVTTIPDADVRDAQGSNGVVSTANPLASAIGLEVLQRGGNAVDAAVAVSFALGLVEPHASGLGGCGYILYAPKQGDPAFIDYRSAAPMGTDPAAFMALSVTERRDSIMGAAVPGSVAGWLEAHADYGTLPLAELLEPTIRLAEEGFEVSPSFAQNIVDYFNKIAADPACSKLFLDEGLPYAAGATLKNPDYAQTLRIIAERGAEGFYAGAIAEAIVAASDAKNGVMSLEDLASYEVFNYAPVTGTYRGYTILSSAPSSSGGTAIIESLNILERYNLAAMGHNTAPALHLLAETFKLVNIDRYNYLGDGAYNDLPVETLLSKDYADMRAEAIRTDSVLTDLHPGDIPYESPSTTHFSIVDSEGNLISVTNTLGTFFGCGTGVAGYGFMLDNQMYDFSVEEWEVNFPQPGKRPRSSMSPTIIYKPDGTPFASLGSPGGDAIVPTMVQMILNLVDYEMDVQAAIDAPRIYQNYTGALVTEGGIDTEVIAALEAMGHTTEQRGPLNSYFGGVQAVLQMPGGDWSGGADPRRDGKALAY